jgi:hypothetical protein
VAPGTAWPSVSTTVPVRVPLRASVTVPTSVVRPAVTFTPGSEASPVPLARTRRTYVDDAASRIVKRPSPSSPVVPYTNERAGDGSGSADSPKTVAPSTGRRSASTTRPVIVPPASITISTGSPPAVARARARAKPAAWATTS